MKLDILKGTTSRIIDVFIQDSSSAVGAGLTGVLFDAAGFTAYYYLNDAPTGATQITLATMTIGTWATGGFIEVDQADMPGVYSLSIPNAALTGADSVVVMLKGATDMAPVVLEIQLTAYDPYAALATPTNITAGTIAVVTTNSDMRGTDDALLAANVPTNFADLAITVTAGLVSVGTLPSIPANWITAAGINAAALNGKGNWNIGKTGYALTVADWNVGKTGYALTQNFPTNFADLSITVTSGLVELLAATQSSIDAIETDTDTTIPGLLTTLQSDTDDIQTRLPDALVGGNIKSDMLAISGDVAAADNLEESATAIVFNDAKAGTLSPTQMSTNLTELTNDHYIGRTIIWLTGDLAEQASDITDYVGTNGVLTYSTTTEAPLAGDKFVIV